MQCQLCGAAATWRQRGGATWQIFGIPTSAQEGNEATTGGNGRQRRETSADHPSEVSGNEAVTGGNVAKPRRIPQA
eukprot:5245363-Pyramimonas_sp.AAC.1